MAGSGRRVGSAQFVHDPEAFNRHADRFLNWIVGMDLDVIRAMPRSAGFNPEQQRRIAEFLTVNQRTLPDDVSTMMRSLYKPFRMLGVPQDAEAANLRARLLDLQGELAEIKRIKAHRAALMLRQIRLVLAPPPSRRTRVLGWILRRVGALFK